MHTWTSQVRDYELDIQQVVNNANYLNYFEHARHLMLRSLGINFVEWHQQQLEFILVESHIKYKKPLKAYDEFIVTTNIALQGKIRLLIEQTIRLVESHALIAELHSIGACIDRTRNRACMPSTLVTALGK